MVIGRIVRFFGKRYQWDKSRRLAERRVLGQTLKMIRGGTYSRSRLTGAPGGAE